MVTDKSGSQNAESCDSLASEAMEGQRLDGLSPEEQEQIRAKWNTVSFTIKLHQLIILLHGEMNIVCGYRNSFKWKKKLLRCGLY